MRATRDELPIIFGADPAAIRGQDWDGLRSLILSLPAGTDLGPLLQGLPGDLCPCPHWGYGIKGQVSVTYADNEEILTPYTGTVPGEAIQEILPCAEGDEFDATFRVDSDGYLQSAEITGRFFPGVDDDITYTITVTEYDVERDITAP